tara:strand:- start:77 stop:1219 length:1143 start_codon:yes stop_codon:yes gene_type:complete
VEAIVEAMKATDLDRAERMLQEAQSPELSTEEKLFFKALIEAHRGNSLKAKEFAQRSFKVENPVHRFYMARILLGVGEWEKALELFDSSRGFGVYGGALLTQKRPLWNGEDLEGKVLLVASEGGLGDVICFSRFVSPFEKLGARVLLATDGQLFPLFRQLPGVSAQVDLKGIEFCDFDFWLPLMSAPRLLKMGPHQIPRKPFLTAPEEVLPKWRSLVRSSKPLKVALCTLGREEFAEDHLRSLKQKDVEFFLNLFSEEELQRIDFFTMNGPSQKNFLNDSRIQSFYPHISTPMDLAGFLSQMDLVVSVDSGPAHMAGALGRPTLLLNRVMGWWTFGYMPRTSSPQESLFYESFEILHQKVWGEWKETLQRAHQRIRDQWI